MQDSSIVDMFWARNEQAIAESDRKYGRMLGGISRGITGNSEDSEECLNDTYIAAWNAMPTDRPENLGAYLSRIIRNLSLDIYKRRHRQKRGDAGELIDELCEAVGTTPFEEHEQARLAAAINRFVGELPETKRKMFVLRYYYAEPIEKIAVRLLTSRSNVKTTLFRIRGDLREFLRGEDLTW